ncbi:cache domain-containing sensor histidine kinase [Bacillus niameyensis]|uniref:cache domain-containing sensor histidine kinase n=1 Tax=Bacillus niameyensis TaxID=1522308 RepID=UPI000784C8EF|nr:sensor histidine kinase [Bacillus niameyensis]
MKTFFFWYRNFSIATKQFIFLFISTLLIFGSLLWNNQNDSEKLFRNQVIYDSQKILGNTNMFLNAYLENIQNILLTLSLKDELLLSENADKINNELRTYADIHSSIVNTIYMISMDQKVYSSHNVFYEILGNPEISHLYELSKQNYGGINWSEPYHSPMSAGNTVGFVSPINSGNEFIGVVVIEIDLQQLTSHLSPMLLNKNQTFMILTSTGAIVSTDIKQNSIIPKAENEYPLQPSKSFIQVLNQLPNGVHDLENFQLPLVSIKSDKNRLGWSLISLIDENIFYENVNKLYDNFKNAAIFLIVSLLLSTFTLSRYFTKPIRKLAKEMDAVTSLNNLSKIPVDQYDEVGNLTRSYNEMVDRIQFLFKENRRVERLSKEYELKMLQSQIGPHFLYNTLACIGSLAKQNKTDEVRTTIRSLVGLLSFSFDKRAELVTLAEELESLNYYSQIQEMRYRNKFSLKILVEPELYTCKIPKLTLQPFVENAIFHGISAKDGLGEIQIKGILSRGKIYITIRDNGVGIEKKRLKDLLKQPAAKPMSDRFNNIGMTNVHERIRIYFGDEYGIRIKSMEGIGTVVRIALPSITEQNIPTKSVV